MHNLLSFLINISFLEYRILKVTTEAALGLIGGTMGLLTGFSILSGVEIVYYLLRFWCYTTFPNFVGLSPGSSCLSGFPRLR